MKYIRLISLSLTTIILPNQSANAENESIDTLQNVLFEAAERLDCYFTIEGLMIFKDGTEVEEGYLNKNVVKPPYISDVTELMRFVDIHWKEMYILKNKDNERIYHVIDKKCYSISDYPFNNKVDNFNFKGTLGELLLSIGEINNKIKMENAYIFPGCPPDTNTHVVVNNYSGNVRGLLCEGIPLRKYRRIIWNAVLNNDKEDIEIKYMGYSGHLLPANKMINVRLIKLDGNGVKDSIEIRNILINKAINEILKEKDKRWPMLLLGEYRAEEAVQILLDFIDWEYAKCNPIEERYPAISALANIGGAAVKPALNKLKNDSNRNKRIILCELLKRILDKKRLIELLKNNLEQENDVNRQSHLKESIEVVKSMEE